MAFTQTNPYFLLLLLGTIFFQFVRLSLMRLKNYLYEIRSGESRHSYFINDSPVIRALCVQLGFQQRVTWKSILTWKLGKRVTNIWFCSSLHSYFAKTSALKDLRSLSPPSYLLAFDNSHLTWDDNFPFTLTVSSVLLL